MKLKIYDFEIREDRNGFILDEYYFFKDKEGEEKYGLKDTIFPSTLNNCFKTIIHRSNKNKDIVLNIEQYKKELEKTYNDFLNELTKILGNK